MLLPLLAVVVAEPVPVPFVISPPALVIELEQGQIHGRPIQLAWSEDSGHWYLETLDGDGPSASRHRFEIAVGDKGPRPIDAAPEWASSYWTFKSNRAVPAHPTILITVDESKRTGMNIGTQSGHTRAAGAMGGNNGGGDPAVALRSAQDASVDFANSARVLTLTVDGKTISTLVDEPLVPGMTFGWSPSKYDAVAYRNDHRHGLSVLHLSGAIMDVPNTKEVLLPAWSPDGTKIAFLEQVGKKKWALRQVTVSLP